MLIQFLTWILNNKFFLLIFLFLERLGIKPGALSVFFPKFLPEQIKKNEEFYSENWARVEKNIELLADQKSKEIYLAMINLHRYGNYKFHPGVLGGGVGNTQYFPKDLIKLREDEVFIDCGGYIGDTIKSFLSFCNGKFRSAVMFEPNKSLEKQINKNFGKYKSKIHWLPFGVYSESKVLKFNVDQDGGGASNFSEDGCLKVPVCAIDDVKECENATFIKMDIEGSEQDALKGSKNTILKNKPTLAICIYHSNEDMVQIIEYIHHLVPEYKLYVRQHAYNRWETVLYAIL